MSVSPGATPVPQCLVEHSQTEVRAALEALGKLAETTGLDSWSDELHASYYRAVDELAALAIHLHLYEQSLPRLGQGEPGAPYGSSFTTQVASLGSTQAW